MITPPSAPIRPLAATELCRACDPDALRAALEAGEHGPQASTVHVAGKHHIAG